MRSLLISGEKRRQVRFTLLMHTNHLHQRTNCKSLKNKA